MKALFYKTTDSVISVVLSAVLLICMFSFSVPAAYAGSTDNTFTFTDSSITASDADGSGFKIEGTALTINESGTYRITGSCDNGSVQVKKGTTGVTLILDDLSLTSSDTAPLSCNKTTEVTIYISGTVTLTDAENPDDEDSTDETVADAFEGAAIKVKSGASVVITGTGTLTADGSACKNGINGASTASITVGASASDSFTLNVKAANHGLASDGSLTIIGGKVNVTATNDGIKSDPDEDDTESEGIVTITDGTINVTAGDDGIKGTNKLTITGGTLNVSAADDGIKSDYDVVIGTKGSSSGPTINITNSNEGIEGATVTFYSGSGTIVASDDGVNAANSDLTNYSFLITVAGGEWIVNADGDGVDSNGNLVNSGGSMTVYGAANNGNAAVDIGDSGCSWTVSGGEIAAIGMSGMVVTPTNGVYVKFGSSGMMGGFGGMPGGFGDMPGGNNNGMPSDNTDGSSGFGGMTGGNNSMPGGNGGMRGGFGGMPGGNGITSSSVDNTDSADSSISISAGNTLALKDSSGNTIWSGTAVKAANSFLYAGSELTSGESYTLYVNGSAAATVTASEGTGQTTQMGPGGQAGQGPSSSQNSQPDQNGQNGQSGQSDQEQQPGQNVGGFQDVNSSAYYAEPVKWAVEQGITSGTGDTTFSPGDSCTRAQAVTFLWRAAGSPTPTTTSNPFSDVKASDYYYNAVLWAYENGITQGSSKTAFSPDGTVTRAQVVTFLQRMQNGSASGTNSFSDVNTSDYYYDAVLWAVTNKITNGTGETTFSPNETCTRAQIVTFIYRALNAA